MQTGAVITAAGMSSRMGDFKPMLNIGSISIAQRVVATLRQAGVGKIVMVTGYQALQLERHLAGNGIVQNGPFRGSSRSADVDAKLRRTVLAMQGRSWLYVRTDRRSVGNRMFRNRNP